MPFRVRPGIGALALDGTQFDSNDTSATDVLNDVASIFARGDSKGR